MPLGAMSRTSLRRLPKDISVSTVESSVKSTHENITKNAIKGNVKNIAENTIKGNLENTSKKNANEPLTPAHNVLVQER